MREWAARRRRDVANNGLEGVRRALHDVHARGLGDLFELVGPDRGTPVYELDWDLLVILDACRHDLMCEVADEYDFVGEVGEHRSVGSNSREWLGRNFGPEWRDETRATAMVTANPYSADILDANDFALLDETWRYAWDDDLSTVPARPVTDRTITVARERDPERLVAHYMQPHARFVPRPEIEPGPDERDIWRAVLRGRVDREEVWDAYRENLRYVLDDVAVLLENVDAERVLITADHGNAVGEWGVYGHPSVPIDVLRKVPAVWTSATDRRTHEPAEYDADVVVTEADVSARLTDLGYLDSDHSEH